MKFVLFVTLFLELVFSGAGRAQTISGDSISRLEQRLSDQENQISSLKLQLNDAAVAGTLSFLFAAFCALWAQNTNRNAWLWFFCGLFFTVIAVVILLIKNSNDRFNRKLRQSLNL
jgi:4-hydroxybenzoate polyprenyltransferase